MPLTAKGAKIRRSMHRQYGDEEGERVFYASANKGTIKGVHGKRSKRNKRSSKRSSRRHKSRNDSARCSRRR